MFSSSKKMSVVDLKHSVIYLPKVNHEYRITQGTNKYSIIFKGNPAAMPLLFNSSIGNLRWPDKLNDYRVLYYYIAKESLPPINNNISFPLLWVSPTLSTEPIITATIVKKMKLIIPNKSDIRVISTYGESISLETCNQKFKEIFQKYIDAPLKVGDYPIFLSKNRPSFSYLEQLYNNFIECNSDEKLNIQYKDTTDKCHVRAHFISELFYKNGIQTYKIFKVWDPKHWKNYSHEAWKYHCDTLLIDNRGKAYIWGPWIGFNKNLLTLKEWSYNPQYEPKPLYILITNRMVSSDFNEGAFARDAFYRESSPEYDFQSFQAIASCVPIPPCYSLPLDNYSLWRNIFHFEIESENLLLIMINLIAELIKFQNPMKSIIDFNLSRKIENIDKISISETRLARFFPFINNEMKKSVNLVLDDMKLSLKVFR